MIEMKIVFDGHSPFVEINLFLNERDDEHRIKLSMSKTWYKDLIYEIEKIAEEEKKNAEKYLHENNREMMMHAFDIYTKLNEKSKELRNELEHDSEPVVNSQAFGS